MTPRRLLPVAFTTRHRLAVALAALGAAPGSSRTPVRYWPVIESGLAAMSAGVPSAMIDPPCTPAPGADVDDVVGLADRLLVVLDDDDGVAGVAQVLQRGQQPAVVALVQTDRRLVEHVEHAGQPASRSGDASRMRWLSPPERVPALRASVR